MKVLIASAHLRTSRAKLWRELQWKYVSRYTDVAFEYAIVASGSNPDAFTHANLVLPIPASTHLACIFEIMHLFRERSDFTHLLLLDSDAWPVRSWFKVLHGLMSQKTFSAPMRIETYNDFPHPCAFFMKREVIDSVNFEGTLDYCNLLGMEVNDIGAAMADRLPEWLPLIRTNVWSPHPLFGAVYGDLFYHHGAGSRGPGIRLSKLGVYDHILREIDHRKIYDTITGYLREDSDRFIDRLRGKDGFPHY